MKNSLCWLFHSWSNWSTYQQPIVEFDRDGFFGRIIPESRITYNENRQKRRCLNCNKVQDERV